MITVDQIPADVKKAMRAAWARRNNSDAPEKHMADLAVAALNAWPGMHTHEWQRPWLGGMSGTDLILPLAQTQEDGDDC